MNASHQPPEAELQAQALQPAQPGEPAAVQTYRRIYAGIRWAPLPALDPRFAERVAARAGIAEAQPDRLERRLLPLLFAVLGVSGGVSAGPALLGVVGQVAARSPGLPWLQAASAMAALGTAAALDRLLARRGLRWR